MAAPQTSVSDRMDQAFAGMIVDSGMDKNVRSYVNAESSAEIRFGIMVAQGTGDDDAILLTATSNKLLGVVAHQHAYAKDNELGTTGLKPDATLGVLTHGRIWVQVEEAVSPGDAVRVRAVVAGDEVKGAFRTSADSTDCIDISEFARWLSSADAAGLAILEIDMTNSALAAAD